MKCLVIVCMCFIAHNPILGTNVTQWEAYKAKYGKKYDNSTEDKRRQDIWKENLKIIEEHNKGNNSYTMAMNSFGDFTPLEYQDFLLGTNLSLSGTESGSTCLLASTSRLPDKVDWRDKGYVTPVKNQGRCGSCWAFSATGSLEGQHYKKTKNLVPLSEQNLVDCSGGKFRNHGCRGGFMTNAFNYIIANHGIDTEGSYPYTGKNGACKYNPSTVGATCTGYVSIRKGSEHQLQYATATIGPISVAINASSFRFYSNGVYDDPDCGSSYLNHAVLVVGYGTLDGKDFWLVKNSWGTSWGMEGYILMSRNKNNQCGIATAASYPLTSSNDLNSLNCSCSERNHENSGLRSKSWGKLSIILSIFVALVIDGR